MGGMNTVRCQRTGESFAIKLGGGWCVCPSVEECRLAEPKPDNTSASGQTEDR